MLKKRIKKWDFDRNHKQADMLYAVKVALERDSQGKKTAFLIRGRVVSFEDVQHYFRRKGVRDLRALVKDADVAAPTTCVKCHTPGPSGILAENEKCSIADDNVATEAARDHLHHSSSAVMVVAGHNQVMRVLRQSSELNQLNQLLHYGRDYYASIFETREWRNQQEAFKLSSLESFYHNLFDGYALLHVGKEVELAFWHFDRAFNLIKGILEKGTLLFLPYLYNILLQGRRLRQEDVLLKLLDFISQMIRTRFPHLRPVQDSLVLLCKMSPEQRGYCSSRAFANILDQLRLRLQDCIPDQVYLQRASEVLCLPSWTPSWELTPSWHLVTFNLDGEADGLTNYEVTSLAIWRLARDAELYEPPNFDAEAVPRDEDILKDFFRNDETSRENKLRTAKMGTSVLYIRITSPVETLTTASLQQLDVELERETRQSRKSSRLRQYIAFRPRKRRLGKGQGRIHQPWAKS